MTSQLTDPGQAREAGAVQTLANQLDRLTNVVRDMQVGLRVVALGIDYWRYHRFLQLVPRIFPTADGQHQRHIFPDYAPSQEQFEFCLQFVVTAALRVAELDAYTAPPSWIAGRGLAGW